jgi:hypothetical protein
MNDLASLNGKGQLIKVDGREYRILPLTLDDHGDLLEWLDRQRPDPIEAANRAIARGRLVVAEDGTERREPYPVDMQKFLLRAALETAARERILIGSPEADALLGSALGEREVLYLSLRKSDPSITRARAAEIYDKLRDESRARALDGADVMRAPIDPKATTPAPTTTMPGSAGPAGE